MAGTANGPVFDRIVSEHEGILGMSSQIGLTVELVLRHLLSDKREEH